MDQLAPNEVTQYEQIVHIMLNKAVRSSQLTRIGANYFEKNEQLFGGDNKLDVRGERGDPDIRLWRGYSMTMEQSVSGLQMHVDVVHRVLHQQNVSELIQQTFKDCMRSGGRGDVNSQAQKFAMKKVEDMLKDCCVLTLYNKRVYRIHTVDWSLGIDDKFSKDNKMISYRDYFESAYGEKCSQQFKGMLVHIPKKKKNSNGPDRIILAPELCHMTGLTKKMKSNFMFMRKMADTTRISAADRHKMGSALVARLQENIENGETVTESETPKDTTNRGGRGRRRGRGGTLVQHTVTAAGTTAQKLPLHLNNEAVVLSGHVLPGFKVLLSNSNRETQEVDPYKGLQRAWNDGTFINKQLISIRKWVIMYEEEYLADICFNHMKNVSRRTGLWGKVLNDNPEFYEIRRGQKPQHIRWRDALEEAHNTIQPQLILCILPDDRRGNATAVYNMIKTHCCTQNPILTQCISTRSLTNQKRVMSIMKNVVKQMLTKAGNTPWRAQLNLPDGKLNVRKIPTMICGMDVNHDMKRNVSTVGMCASYTADCTQYFTFVMHQAFGREVMIDGANLMLEALKKFKLK